VTGCLTVVVLVWMSVRGGAGLVSSAFEVGSFMAVCCSSRACVDTCGVE
jgi:hypothetical protein